MQNNTIKILIVDDNNDNLIVLNALLTEAFNNIAVLASLSGQEAIRLVNKNKPEVIILDIVMPGMDGFEVCKILKSDELTKHIPIIFLTARSDKQSKIKALEIGADAFLSKPVDEAELTAQVKAMLRIKRSEDINRMEKELLSKLVTERTEELEKELTERKRTEEELNRLVQRLERSKFSTLNILEDLRNEVEEHRLAEEKLIESKRLLKLTGQMAKIGGWEFDPRTLKETWSEEVAKIHDLDPEKEVDVDLGMSFYTGDSLKKIKTALNEAVAYGKSYELELELFTAKGIHKWVKAIGTPVIVDNKVVKVHGTFQDITQHKNAADELRESNEQFRAVSEYSHNAICILNEQGKIIWGNNSLAEISGFLLEDLYKAPSFIQFIAPESVEFVLDNFYKFVRQEKYIHHYFFSVIRSDGKKRLFEKYMTDYKDKNGNRRIALSMLDVSDQKAAEEALMLSEEKFRSYVENAPDGIFIANDLQKFVFVNQAACKLTGYSYQELMDLSIKDVIYADDLQICFNHFNTVVSAGKSSGKMRFVKKTGDVGHWEVDAVKLTEDRFLGFAHDITEQKKAEEALKESELIFRTLAEFAPVGIFKTDLTGITTYVNPKWCEISQVSYEEAMGNGWLKAVHPEDKEILFTNWQNAAKNLQTSISEYRFLHKDGTIAWVAGKAELQVDDEGNKYGYVGIISDITEMKKAEKELKKSESRFRSVWESSGSGMRLTNEDGIFIDVNNAFCKIAEKNRKELIGKPISVIYGDKERDRILSKAIARFKNRDIDDMFEKELILWNGKHIWFEVVNSFIEIEDKEPLLLGIFTDISERKKAEKELFESNEFNQYLIESIPFGMTIVDQSGDILFNNFKFEEMFDTGFVGKKCWDIYKYNKKQCQDCPLKSKILIGKTKIIDVYDELQNRFFEISHTGISYKGELVILEIFHDVTEKRKMVKDLISAKEKAEEMSRLKSNFLANMNHELRTPLNGILGFASILSEELGYDLEHKEMAKSILQSGKRLSDTLSLLLDLSNIEAEKVEITTSLVNVSNVIKNVCDVFVVAAMEKGLRFKSIIKDKNIYAKLDELYFITILNNLIDNAIKYCNVGTITIETGTEFSDDNHNLYIKVIDTGIGIPKEKLNIIWKAFRQVSEGLNRSFEGTGLGLTIAKKLTELMHGVISVESEDGCGTVFTVKFPTVIETEKIVPPQTESDKKLMPDVVIKDQFIMPSILYVEDDTINQNVVKLFVKNLYSIDTADNAIMGLQMTKQKIYDAILMDINLGHGMNGIQLTKEIKLMPEYFATPIIAVTAYTMESDKTEFMEAGCTHYLAKPFLRNNLLDLLGKALNGNNK
ncbi:MAG: PAS domain S-box protein [bacterium]